MRQTAIAFKSKGVTLEGVVASPQGISGTHPGVVVCHPHLLFGGNMENAVVRAVCEGLVKDGFTALRFNFRGVGNSEGSFTKGEAEQEDVLSALDLLRKLPGLDGKSLGLVGYSFGASVILKGLSRHKRARTLALISPPLTSLEDPGIREDTRPKLFLVGDRDRLVPEPSLKEKVDALGVGVDLRLVPGADHSWQGFEAEAANQVVSFCGGTLRK